MPYSKDSIKSLDTLTNSCELKWEKFGFALKSFGCRLKKYSNLEHPWQRRQQTGNACQGEQWIREASNAQNHTFEIAQTCTCKH